MTVVSRHTEYMDGVGRMMAAAVLKGDGRTEVVDVERPRPGPGQVRVRLEGCGVCSSSLPAWQGREWFQYPWEPGAPGHEGWGYVDELGAGVEHIGVGERVAMLSTRAFAEYDVCDAAHVVPLPVEIAGEPFPGEALGCAFNIWRRSGVNPGDRVAVVGVGFIGAMLVQLAARHGASVTAISRRSYALRLAARFGASATCAVTDVQAASSQVLSAGSGVGCDVVIECTGRQGALDLSTAIVGEGGRIVIAGYHQDGLRSVNMQQWNWKGIDVINAHERDPLMTVAGMREAAEAAAAGDIDYAPLCTHELPLRELDAAFRLLERREDDVMKVTVIP